jgi:carbon monoxide dehydrogenase subunit G
MVTREQRPPSADTADRGATPTAGASGAAPPAWQRWLRRVALILGFGSLLFVVDIVSREDKVVRAQRPDLGVIKLTFGKGPSGVKGWTAHFNLDVSVSRAWQVLRSCENLPKVLKGVASCKLLEQERDGMVKIHRMVLTHPEGAYMRTRTVYDPVSHRTRWKMVQGSFQAAEGGIELKAHPELNGWTRVRYAYFLAISSVLPESFEVPRVRRSVRRMAREIQRYFSDKPVRPLARQAGARAKKTAKR